MAEYVVTVDSKVPRYDDPRLDFMQATMAAVVFLKNHETVTVWEFGVGFIVDIQGKTLTWGRGSLLEQSPECLYIWKSLYDAVLELKEKNE
jgi:hypothetical protein